MSLSKGDITELIRKRRKKTLHNTISFLQSQAYDEDLYFTDPRNASVITRYNLSRQWPNHQYIHMRTKDVPYWAYRSWFSYYISSPEGKAHVWPWEPKDHEWMLSQLLE